MIGAIKASHILAFEVVGILICINNKSIMYSIGRLQERLLNIYTH